jgi:hypothetical protein
MTMYRESAADMREELEGLDDRLARETTLQKQLDNDRVKLEADKAMFEQMLDAQRRSSEKK